MENVKRQLEQFKIDSIYGKRKHYNAAERKRKLYRVISISQIILNAITGTTLLTVVFGDGSKIAELLALVFTIITTVLASVQKICDFENQAQGNAKVADMYLRISKKTNLILCEIKDELLEKSEITSKAEEICSEVNEVNELASQFSTSPSDYQKAQIGIKNGEENYTEEELKIWA